MTATFESDTVLFGLASVYEVQFAGFIGTPGAAKTREKVFYKVDGPGLYDPADQDTDVNDPDLEGKTIDGVFQTGFRFLIPGVEYQALSDGILLLGGLKFSRNDIVMLEISY